MNTDLLQQANYILDACGRQVPPPNTNYVDIPAHIGYSRFMPGGSNGTEDIGGVMHKGRAPFLLRAITAQSLPRDTQGIYWRMRLPSGQYFQSAMTSHAMAFGFGSDRQAMIPEIEWGPGEKIFIDLDTKLAGPPPANGYTVVFMLEGVYRFPLSGPARITNPIDLDRPRYYLAENQNILAPPAAFWPGCPSETPDGFTDEEFCYVSQTVNLPCGIPGSPISNVPLQIEPGSDFVVREVWPYIPSNTGSGSVVVRMHRGDGYVLSSNFIPINHIQGPMFKELLIRRGDTFYFDAYIVDGSTTPGDTITFGLYLYGVKRREVIS